MACRAARVQSPEAWGRGPGALLQVPKQWGLGCPSPRGEQTSEKTASLFPGGWEGEGAVRQQRGEAVHVHLAHTVIGQMQHLLFHEP